MRGDVARFRCGKFAKSNRNLQAGLILFLAIGTGVTLAHEGAKGVVKERMDLMKGQAKQMKLIGDMAKGKKTFDATKAAAAAKDLGATTKKIPDLSGRIKRPSKRGARHSVEGVGPFQGRCARR
jgi:cytochrome c556